MSNPSNCAGAGANQLATPVISKSGNPNPCCSCIGTSDTGCTAGTISYTPVPEASPSTEMKCCNTVSKAATYTYSNCLVATCEATFLRTADSKACVAADKCPSGQAQNTATDPTRCCTTISDAVTYDATTCDVATCKATLLRTADSKACVAADKCPSGQVQNTATDPTRCCTTANNAASYDANCKVASCIKDFTLTEGACKAASQSGNTEVKLQLYSDDQCGTASGSPITHEVNQCIETVAGKTAVTYTCGSDVVSEMTYAAGSGKCTGTASSQTFQKTDCKKMTIEGATKYGKWSCSTTSSNTPAPQSSSAIGFATAPFLVCLALVRIF